MNHILYVFHMLQALWLSQVADPGVLVLLRVSSAVFAMIAAAVAIRSALAPNTTERTWSARECQIYRVLMRILAGSLIMIALYFICAGSFEASRTSSPVRLLIADTIFSVHLWTEILFLTFLRAQYSKKRVRMERFDISVRS